MFDFDPEMELENQMISNYEDNLIEELNCSSPEKVKEAMERVMIPLGEPNKNVIFDELVVDKRYFDEHSRTKYIVLNKSGNSVHLGYIHFKKGPVSKNMDKNEIDQSFFRLAKSQDNPLPGVTTEIFYDSSLGFCDHNSN